MNAHMEWEWRTNLSTVHKNICMLLFFKKTKSKKSVEWGGEIARVNCFKSFGDKNSCFPFPALIGEKKLLQLIPWNKDLSDVLPLVGKESVKNGGENTTTWSGGEPTLLFYYFIIRQNWGFLFPNYCMETSAANLIIFILLFQTV